MDRRAGRSPGLDFEGPGGLPGERPGDPRVSRAPVRGVEEQGGCLHPLPHPSPVRGAGTARGLPTGEAWEAFNAFRLDQGIKADFGRNTFYDAVLVAGARLGVSRTRTDVGREMRGFRVTTQAEQEAYDGANGETGLSRFGKDGAVRQPSRPTSQTTA